MTMGSEDHGPGRKGGPSRTRVIVADPHPIYRQGLAEAIGRRPDLEAVAVAADAETAVAGAARLTPEVAVIELQLAKDGPDVIERICGEGSGTRVLLLCGRGDGEAIYRAIEAGAVGCLLKEQDAEELAEAIAAAGRGEPAFEPRAAELVAHEIRRRRHRDEAELSEREVAVLRLTAEGLSSDRVGEELAISQSTVKNHLSHIYAKLGVVSAAAAVSEAMRLELLGLVARGSSKPPGSQP
jgi:two-component system, NarL family, nitrate/nitrite response regulator NarL